MNPSWIVLYIYIYKHQYIFYYLQQPKQSTKRKEMYDLPLMIKINKKEVACEETLFLLKNDSCMYVYGVN